MSSFTKKRETLDIGVHHVETDSSIMSGELLHNEEDESVLDETLVPLISNEIKSTMSQWLVLPPSSALDSDQRPWISEFWQTPYCSLDSTYCKFFIELVNEQKKNIMMLMNQDNFNQNEELSSQPPLLNLSLLEEKLRISQKKKIWLKMSTLDDYDVISFIKEFSRFIYHVVISSKNPKEGRKFLQLINENFSHIVTLTISNEMFVNDDDEDDDVEDENEDNITHQSLTQLKILKFYATSANLNISSSLFIPNFKILVQIAPNIKKIYGFPLKFYTVVKQELGAVNMKIPSIKSIFISSSPSFDGKKYFTQIENLIKTSSASLEELDVSLFFKDDGGNPKIKLHLYNEILKCSQNTLKKLTVGPGPKFGFLERLPYSIDEFIQYPRLEVLQTLHLKIKTEHCGHPPETCFHNGFNLNQVFPNVTTLEITYGDGNIRPMKNCPNLSYYLNTHFPLNIFIPCETLLTVQRIKISNFIPGELFYHLGKVLFNQLTALTLKSTPEMLSPILSDVFKICPDLGTLRLEIDMKNGDQECINLDDAMTGMSEERCKAMRMRMNFGAYMGLKAKDMKQVCVGPGIYLLKELQLLQIVFQGEVTPCEPIFSYLSGVFAFGLMPQCKIIIGFNATCTPEFIHGIYSTLEPIAPYVTIEI